MATTLGAVAEGSIVYLNESGAAVPFYVAKHDYESGLNGAGRVLLVRQDCYQSGAWDSTSNEYAGSKMDTWMTETYLAKLESFVQKAAGTTTIYATSGASTEVKTISRTVFALSLTEYGLVGTYANVEGSELPTAGAIAIANLRGEAESHWTRTPRNDNAARAYLITATGGVTNSGKSGSLGYRPCITLPAGMGIDDGNNVIETPYEYTWVEYIESSGTQWINSEYCPTENTRVVASFKYKSTPTSNSTVFGTRSADTLQFWTFYRPNSKAFVFRFGDTSELPAVSATPTERNTFDANKNVLTIGENKATATADTLSTTYPLYLLAVNNAGSAKNLASGYLYSCKIYENGTLMRDFVPAVRSGGTVGLYDKLNDRFYTNSGTGTFTAGPEIVESTSLSKAGIDGVAVLLSGGYATIDGVTCPVAYMLVDIDGVTVTVPFGEAQESVMLISFSYKAYSEPEVTYQAEEGMTFRDWVDSEYNVDGWTYSNYSTYGVVLRGPSGYPVTYDSNAEPIPADNVIEDGDMLSDYD